MAEDLRTRIAEVLNTTPAGFVQAEPDGVENHARHEWHRHDRHRYNATCALCRGEEDTLTDAVLAELEKAQALADAAWGSVWLHGKWSWLTKNMSTEQREYAADCVARWSAALNADDPNLEVGEPEGLRWWREPERPSSGLRGLLEHVGIDVAGRVITVDGVPMDSIGVAPKPEPPCGYCGCTTPSADCTTCNHDEETPR